VDQVLKRRLEPHVNLIIKVEASNIMHDVAIHHPKILRNHLIEILGEVVEHQGTRMRRLAAREIINRDKMMFNASDEDSLMLEIADLEFRLARPSIYFARELLNEPVPYSADGILFPVLVHLVRRIEEDLFGWGWLPEQARALGLAVNPGEELAWPTSPDSYAIRDEDGNCHIYYRIS
jgi:hypothetical protein